MTSIRDMLVGKTRDERVVIKSDEIVKTAIVARTVTLGVDVDIESARRILGGVEIIARAFTAGGVPIGFGPKGSIEFERFQIMNPPILVFEGMDGDTPRFREDPREAVRQSVAHMVSVVGKTGGAIVKGTVGNTVTEFRPNDTTGAPVDGVTSGNVSESTWAEIVGGAGVAASGTGTREYLNIRADTVTDEFDQLSRFIHGFPTGTLGTDTINSATITLYSAGASNTEAGADPAMDIVSSAPASDAALVAGDFDSLGTTVFATKAWASLSLGNAGANVFTLDANGLAHIDGADHTFFGVRWSWDTTATFGGTWTSGGIWNNRMYFANQSGTNVDPVLIVDHEAGGGTTVPLTGTITGTASPTGDLTVTKSLSGTVTGAATPSGDLTIQGATVPLSGTVTGTASPSGDLTVSKPLSGTITGQALPTGNLTIQTKTIQLTGTITGTASPTGDLTVDRALVGTITGTASMTGVLTGVSSAPLPVDEKYVIRFKIKDPL